MVIAMLNAQPASFLVLLQDALNALQDIQVEMLIVQQVLHAQQFQVATLLLIVCYAQVLQQVSALLVQMDTLEVH